MMSANPAVVTSATRPPLRSSKALVATVVPWPSTAGRAPTDATPAATATEGSAGVDGTLATTPVSLTTSVNVPPVSTPTRVTADRSLLGLDHPDVLLAEVVLERPHQLADGLVLAVPHDDGLMGVPRQPGVAASKGGA